ncbi:hypothetical protein V8B97DRAFT_2002289 [Scleroderma yunnanense]
MEATTPVLMTEASGPPARSTTILGSLLRGRPRGVSASNQQQQHSNRQPSPASNDISPSQSPPAAPSATTAATNNNNNNNPLSPISPLSLPPNHRRRSFAPQGLVIPQPTSTNNSAAPASSTGPSLGISHILRRRRSIGGGTNNATLSPTVTSPLAENPPATAPNINTTASPPTTAASPTNTTNNPNYPNLALMPLAAVNRGPPNTSGNFQHHRIRLVPHLDSRRTLRFEPITRDLKDDDPPLRIGRFTDRAGAGLAAQNLLNSNKLAFKSKVVSRAHAEIWIENGRFYIRDTKSSSGTFLNHLRLASAGHESKPFQLRDGDILQLGVDYQGGSEDIYKSVKIRVEVGREWQAAANAFNTNAITQLKSLGIGSDQPKSNEMSKGKKRLPKPNIPDCCICLFAVTIRQALFIAPCSHAFHYKCIKPLLEKHTSAFSCPLCRSFADLEEDVEVDADHEVEEDETDGEDADGTPSLNRGREQNDSGGAEWEDGPRAPISAPVQANTLALSSNISSHPQRHHLAAPNPSQPRDGAETEVETDMIQSQPAHHSRRPRVTVRTEGHITVPSTVPLSAPVLGGTGLQGGLPPFSPFPPPHQPRDVDEDMVDGDLDDGDLYAADADVDAYVIRGAGPFDLGHPGNSSAAAVVRDDLSEGERSGSGSIEGALGLDLGISPGIGMIIERGGPDGEGAVSGGKRKR